MLKYNESFGIDMLRDRSYKPSVGKPDLEAEYLCCLGYRDERRLRYRTRSVLRRKVWSFVCRVKELRRVIKVPSAGRISRNCPTGTVDQCTPCSVRISYSRWALTTALKLTLKLHSCRSWSECRAEYELRSR